MMQTTTWVTHNFEKKKQDTKDYIGHNSIYKSSKSGQRNYIV